MRFRDVPDVPGLQEVLSEQHGVVSVAQLKALGLTAAFARARVRAGRWQRPHRQVYVVFSGGLDRKATIWAALLRCGPSAVAGHQTAAELDGLCGVVDERIHVVVEAARHVRMSVDSGIHVHYATRLSQSRHPVKSPPRTRLDETVLDLVDASRNAQSAAAWITAAVQKRMTTPSRLAEALARRKKFQWRRMARAMLHDVAEGAQSVLELEHMWKVERAHGIPAGTRQRRVVAGSQGGQVAKVTAGQVAKETVGQVDKERVIWVDVDHEDYGVRIELDGRVGHAGEGAFRDRRRDNRGTVDGRWTLRYGHAEVFGTPCDVAAEEVKVLQDRGWRGQPKRCGPHCTVP